MIDHRALFLKASFSPNFFGIFINPFWLCRSALANCLFNLGPMLEGKILDFGAGTQPYRQYMTKCKEYVSLEYDTEDNRRRKVADIFYDGNSIPLPSNDFDGILSTQTLEHVPNPGAIVAEWNRVLKPGGLLLITVPFMWPEHEMPYDFQRYASGGLVKLLQNGGFDIVINNRLLADFRAPMQLLIAWVLDAIILKIKSPAFRLSMVIVLCCPLSLVAWILAPIFPKNTNMYLDNVVLARSNKAS